MSDTALPSGTAGTDKNFFRHLLFIWLAACVVSAIVHARVILGFDMSDPDDHLRLVQVRDFLAGQSWFDVSQHRMNPPAGGDMHWSRLVDLPIAAGFLLLTPLLGTHAAETVTMAIVPLLLLALAMAALAAAARRLLGDKGALVTIVLIMLMPTLVRQLGPMRIDHHGWQILMAACSLAALLTLKGKRSGIAAGLAAALWVQVSAESLPYVAAIGGLLGLLYLLDEAERPRLVAYLGALAAGSTALFVATRPAAEWLAPKCDALSTPFLVPFVAAAAVVAAGASLPVARTRVGRGAVLGVAGAIAAAFLVKLGSGCVGGPFGSLDPLVRDFWYHNVPEGLPIWMQRGSSAIGTLWTPAVGAIGTWLAWRSAEEQQAKRLWAMLAALLAAATGVAMLVYRAEAVAHLYALPGCAYLLIRVLRWARSLGSAAFRVPATVAAFLLPSPAPAMIWATKLEESSEGSSAAEKAEAAAPDATCTRYSDYGSLAGMKPMRVLAPLDIGPALLAATPHSIMAAGYHRNHLAMKDVILTFFASEEDARRYVEQRGVGLVVYCRNLPEIDRYIMGAPDGLMARLERGQVPSWLEPVETGGSPLLRAYRVKPAR